MRTRHLPLILAGLDLLATLQCGSAPEDAASSASEAVSACSLTVTENTYDGPDYWGTIGVKNGTGASVTGFDVTFAVPAGAACTSDYVPSGATLATSSNRCTFTWKTTKIAAGATFTFNYSTDSTSFSAATSVTGTVRSCSTGGGGSDAGTGTKDAGKSDSGGTDSGASSPGVSDYAPYFPTWVWGGSGYAFTGLADMLEEGRAQGGDHRVRPVQRRVQHDARR